MIGTLMNRFRSTKSVLRDGDSMLLSQTAFNREVSRERIRATRRSIPFCIVTVQLLGKKQLRTRRMLLVRLLHRNLRLTDQKADLARNRFGILLVDTPEMGGRAVLDRISGLCETRGLDVTMSLKVHDPEGFDPDQDQDQGLTTGDGGRRSDDQSDSKWFRVDQSVSSLDQSSGSILMSSYDASELIGGDEQSTYTVTEMVGGDSISGGSTAVAVRPAPAIERERRGSSPKTYVASDDVLPSPRGARRFVKRSLDLIGAGVGLVLVSPILAGSMLAIKITSPGPALFRQTREGRGGQAFTIYKMRTMVVDAESKQSELRDESHRDGPAFKITHDPRVTRVGQFLRKTCIDELPQLINVLKGDMSLVGPRPLPWHESRACERWHRRRLDVRPGMTCHWQVNKAAAETFDDWMRMDLRYVDRNSLWQDLKLIFSTVFVPLTGRGSE